MKASVEREFIPNQEDHLVEGLAQVMVLEGGARAFLTGDADRELHVARVAANLELSRYSTRRARQLGLSRTEQDRAVIRSWMEAKKILERTTS